MRLAKAFARKSVSRRAASERAARLAPTTDRLTPKCSFACYGESQEWPQRNAAMLLTAKVDCSDAVHNGMIWIPGGTFRMGSDKHYPEEAPSIAFRLTASGWTGLR